VLIEHGDASPGICARPEILIRNQFEFGHSSLS
jgi:hypothetical protein